jgi:hypothetical protein
MPPSTIHNKNSHNGITDRLGKRHCDGLSTPVAFNDEKKESVSSLANERLRPPISLRISRNQVDKTPISVGKDLVKSSSAEIGSSVTVIAESKKRKLTAVSTTNVDSKDIPAKSASNGSTSSTNGASNSSNVTSSGSSKLHQAPVKRQKKDDNGGNTSLLLKGALRGISKPQR